MHSIRFDPGKWNVNALVNDNEPRTNNGIESFNGQFSNSVAASHPTIWKFSNELKTELKSSEQRIAAHWGGAKAPKRGRLYEEMDSRLKNLVCRYETVPAIEYLHGIASNLGRMYVAKKVDG